MPLPCRLDIVPALILVLLLAVANASAQEKPTDFLRRVLPHIEPIETPAERPPVAPIDPNAPAKLCFWQDPSVSGFGKSGFCEASSQLSVGTPCRCNEGSAGRPDGKWVGTVILAPANDQSSSVVR